MPTKSKDLVFDLDGVVVNTTQMGLYTYRNVNARIQKTIHSRFVVVENEAGIHYPIKFCDDELRKITGLMAGDLVHLKVKMEVRRHKESYYVNFRVLTFKLKGKKVV